tara:strand:+ start:902 stop:1522 length:621 start_codon:yes stop_codon:yes gene_type:complete
MKKIVFVILIVPSLLFGQQKGDYFLQFNYGLVYDEYAPEMDVNPWSPDMQSEFNGRDDVKEGNQYSFGYYVIDKLSLGINYMDAKISGSNSVEFYDGKFTERNLVANFDVQEFNNLVFFVTASSGKVEWSATRNLMSGDTEMPLSIYEGEADKNSYGGGLRYKFDDFEISLSVVRNTIQHDGFDGWDYGSNNDQYLYQSLGIRLYL